MVTLYKNYVSEFEFDKYIVFLGGATSTLRKDDSLCKFDISNVKDEAIKKIKEGLIDECKKKTYIADKDIKGSTIDEFLEQVYFVVDNQSKGDYVKKIIKLNPAIIPEESILVAIFNEMRALTMFKQIENQIILKTTLKKGEENKYCNRPEINNIDFSGHITNKMLSNKYVERFISIANEMLVTFDA